MPYKTIYSGGTFGPGMSFPDRCLFKNCTFLASCEFGEACDFVNCKFQKCCPKPYSNPNSRVKKGSKLFGCTLEYVTIEQGAEVYEEINTGNRVTLPSPKHPENKTEKQGNNAQLQTTTCGKCGQRINSDSIKTGITFHSCGKAEVEGFAKNKAVVKQKVCGKMK